MDRSYVGSNEIVNLTHVDKVYPPNQYALRDFTLSVERGEFVFIAGASGAGKSSLLKLLIGEHRASRGQISVCGKNLVSLPRSNVSLLRRNIGVVFQDYKLLHNRTVLENVSFALEVLGVQKASRLALAEKLLGVFGLGSKIHSFPKTLSGGEQQRVAIARALIGKPSLILADEPSGNLDPDMAKLVFKLLLEANRCGATVMVASHDLDLIERVNKRTIVLDRGKLVGDFKP